MPEVETTETVNNNDCVSCVNLYNHLEDAEDRAMSIQRQNLVGLIVLNLACWHGVTTHATSPETWFWLLAGSVVILCRDLWASFDFTNPLS